MTVDASTGIVNWLPTEDQQSLNDVLIQVSDGNGNVDLQAFDVLIRPEFAAPQVTSEPPQIATVDELLEYLVTAEDPDNQLLTFSLLDAPAGATIDSVTGLVQWTPAVGDIGSQRIVVLATDEDGLKAIQSFYLDVRDVNVAPEFVSDPVLEATAGATYQYTAIANDADDAVTYSLVNQGVGMTIDPDTGLITWVPDAAEIGTPLDVVVRATDERGLSTDQAFTIEVVADTTAPLVSVVSTNTLLEPDDSIFFQVLASDNVGVTSLVATIDGDFVALAPNGRGVFNADNGPGLYTIAATATDANGNVGTSEVVIRVIDPNDTESPFVEIISPQITDSVTYLTDVVGSVIASDLEYWRLEYSLAGTDNWVELATGTTEVNAGVLDTFDPTLLANDSYDIRLFAQDFSGNQRTEQIFIGVEGQAKLGNYSLSFPDLMIPLAGIPITIVRNYDTLNANDSGDFGFGWNLSISEASIRETIPVGENELNGVPALFGGSDPFYIGAKVFITTPEGQRVGFTFQPEVSGALLGPIWSPKFVADIDTDYELEVPDIGLSQSSDGTFGTYLTGFPYNPREFTLVSKDQMRYTYDQFDELQSVSDRNDVALDYRDDGIYSSTGESIQFVRDDFGRIVEIVDPAGNSLFYSYDSNGDLVTFLDQDNHNWTMEYNESGNAAPHYLEKLVDPRDVTVAEVIYDEAGRFIELRDASGNSSQHTYDLPANQFVMTDRLGFATEVTYDNRGNLTRVEDPLGNVNQFEYDADNNVSAMVDEVGNRTEMTYDDRKNVLSITDALGNTQTFTYDSFNNLASTVDVLGRTASAEFDSNGNLIASINAEGTRTEFTRDALGRIDSFTDAFGNVSQMDFLEQSSPHPSQITYADGTTQNYEYNIYGQPTRSTDENGNIQDYTFSAAGMVTQMVDADGGVHTIEYEAGRVTKFIDPRGLETAYSYDAQGRLESTTDDLGGIMRYVRDAEGRILQEYDETDRLITYTYDAMGRLLSTAINPTYSMVRDARGLVTSETDSDGRETKYEYDELRRLTKVTSPEGRETTYAFNAAGEITSMTDSLGTTSFEYDLIGRITRVTDPLGISESWEYDQAGNVVAFEDGNSNRWTAEYSTERTGQYGLLYPTTQSGSNVSIHRQRPGRLTQLTDPLGNSVSYGYDSVGNLESLTDELGRETTYEYDSKNQITGGTNALGDSYVQEYDSSGNLISFTDELGRQTSYQYDRLDRLSVVTDAEGFSASYAYDAADRLTSFVDENGHETSYVYDDLDRVVEIVDAAQNSETFTYDAVDNLTSFTDRSNATWTYEYDLDNFLTKMIHPDGGEVVHTYDNVGLRTSMVDEAGRVETYTYDSASRLTSVTDFAGFTKSYDYDGNHNLIQFVDSSGNEWNYEFDALDRVISESDPRNGVQSYEFDAVGNLVRNTDRLGRQTEFVYDNLNRLVTETWVNSGYEANYVYDAVDNVTSASDLYSSYTFTYDNLDRLVTSSNAGTPSVPLVELSYTYDGVGNLTALSDQLGFSINSTYDSLDRLTRRSWSGAGTDEAFADFDYNERDGLELIERYEGNGSSSQLAGSTLYEYDSRGRMLEIKHRNAVGGSIRNFEYSYDASNRLTQSIEDGVTKDFTYDARGQLIQVQSAGSILEEYGFDESGNRNTTGHNVDVGNLVSSDPLFDYTYDAEGNLVEKVRRSDGQIFTYEYDFRNRLTRVVESTSGLVEVSTTDFVYDIFDRKILRTVDGVSQASVYSGSRVWADFDGSGQIKTRYILGDESVDHMIARHTTSNGTEWYLQDRLFSIRGISDENGQLVYSVDFDSFGNVEVESLPENGDRFKFTGREWEASIGLYDYRARHYDPESGRFTTEDSWGLGAGDENFYRYVGNSPTNFIDPSGHIAVSTYASVASSVLVFALGTQQQCFTEKAVVWNVAFVDAMQIDGLGIPTPPGIDVQIRSCADIGIAAYANGVFAQMATLFALFDVTQKGLPYDCVRYEDFQDLYSVEVLASCGGDSYPFYAHKGQGYIADAVDFVLGNEAPHSNCFIAGTQVLRVNQAFVASTRNEGMEAGITGWLLENKRVISVVAGGLALALVTCKTPPKQRPERVRARRRKRARDSSDDFGPQGTKKGGR